MGCVEGSQFLFCDDIADALGQLIGGAGANGGGNKRKESTDHIDQI